MGRLIKILLIIILLVVLVILGYGLLGDLSAPSVEVKKPVEIDVD